MIKAMNDMCENVNRKVNEYKSNPSEETYLLAALSAMDAVSFIADNLSEMSVSEVAFGRFIAHSIDVEIALIGVMEEFRCREEVV